MKLNRIEKVLMNNPLRASLQRWYEAPLLEKLGDRLEGKRVLEIGCGRGVGIELIMQRFGAQEVYGLDLDPDMIDLARKRLSHYSPERVHVMVGDVTALPMEDGTFDAVFDFGIIHHVPKWQVAVSEIVRVLRPRGHFFFEEATSQALHRWRAFLDHPTTNRFTGKEFIAEIEYQGITVGGNFVERVFGDFVVGVGRRNERIFF